ncbi:MAG: hypothetical protein CMJ58_06395 [Planctomycetaceae bacterium]|nr:hypothetical protein [Planctomycetaceae bacterium]
MNTTGQPPQPAVATPAPTRERSVSRRVSLVQTEAARGVSWCCRSRPLRWLLVVCVACAASSRGACAGEPFQPVVVDPLTEPWRWRTFTELTGLDLRCLAEAPDGTIWFGTALGPWSYDGFVWTNHTEQLGQPIHSICRGPDGAMLCGLYSAIARYHDGRWSTLFEIDAAPTPFEIRKIAAGRGGAVWAATSWGLIELRESQQILHTSPAIAAALGATRDRFTRVAIMPESVLNAPRPDDLPTDRHDLAAVSQDAAGRVWLVTAEGEVLQRVASTATDDEATGAGEDSATWSVFNEADGMLTGHAPSLLVTDNGDVWVGYGLDGNHVSIRQDDQWRTIALEDAGLPPQGCNALLQTQDGAIWLSSRYVVSRLRDGKWTAYTKPDFAIPSARNVLLQMSDGALWLGGADSELVRIDYQTPRWLTLDDLNFQWESADGQQWFLHRDGRVVVNRDGAWTSYGPEDGLMDAPVALAGTTAGEVWVMGSHQHVAATARFDGQRWNRVVHPNFSWGFDRRGFLEASDGSLWFAAHVDSNRDPERLVGLLQYRDGQWIHHHQPGPMQRDSDILMPASAEARKLYLLGESRDKRIWAARNATITWDRLQWQPFRSDDVELGIIQSMLTTRDGDLWFGSRQFGAYRFDGKTWTHFQGKNSLDAHYVYSLTEASDGTIWAATDRGFHRFDGHGWTSVDLPKQLQLSIEVGDLRASPSGALWINHRPREWNLRQWPRLNSFQWETDAFTATRFRGDHRPPRTAILSGPDEIHSPDNLSILWGGVAQFREPDEARLQFSYRIDARPWSPFTTRTGRAFTDLPAGRHRLEVRARDNDFNVDATPAALDFRVIPPVWRQPWFLGVFIALSALVAAQSYRIFQERSRLRRANAALAKEIDERKQAESELRSSETRLRALVEVIPDMIFRLDADGRFVFAHAVRKEELLAPVDDLLGRHYREFLPPQVVEQFERAQAQARETWHAESFEYELDVPGQKRWQYDARIVAIEGDGSVVVVRNISKRVAAEEALRQSERKLAAIAATVPQALYVFDLVEQRGVFANRDVWQDLGWNSEAVAAMQPNPLAVLLHPDDLQRMRELLGHWARARDGEVFETEFRLKDAAGRWRWFRSRDTVHRRDQHGNVREIIGAANDVTQWKRAEQLLRSHNRVLEQLASARPLATVLETLVDAIEQVSDGMRGSVLLLDGNRLRHGAAPHLPEEYIRLIDGVEIGPAVGSCGTAAYKRQRVVVENTLEDPRWEICRVAATQFGLMACWSQPIMDEHGDVLGTFALYYDEPRSPTEEELALIDQFADLAKNVF